MDVVNAFSPDSVAISVAPSAQRGQAIVRTTSAHQSDTARRRFLLTLACHLSINCGLGLLQRNTGGDLGLLPIDTAKADIAIGPSWPRRERLAI